MTAPAPAQVVSAPQFFLQAMHLPPIGFSELGSVTSKVGSVEYIYNDARGNTHHTKQFGKTEPPTVTLKAALDKTSANQLLLWHNMARAGDKSVRGDALLTLNDASGGQDNKIVYVLENAWCAEVMITGMKAGDNSVVSIEVKITCEKITTAAPK
ncbi:phage tail protein [Actinokineospora sp. 24-640]